MPKSPTHYPIFFGQSQPWVPLIPWGFRPKSGKSHQNSRISQGLTEIQRKTLIQYSPFHFRKFCSEILWNFPDLSGFFQQFPSILCFSQCIPAFYRTLRLFSADFRHMNFTTSPGVFCRFNGRCSGYGSGFGQTFTGFWIPGTACGYCNLCRLTTE